MPSIHNLFEKGKPPKKQRNPTTNQTKPKYIHCRRLIRKNIPQFLLSSLQKIHVSVYKHVFLAQTIAFFLKACGINAKKHQNGTIWRLTVPVQTSTTLRSSQETSLLDSTAWQCFPGNWCLFLVFLVSDKYTIRSGKWKIPFVNMFQYLQMEVCLRNHMSLIPGVPHNNRIQETANPNHISKRRTTLY